MVGNVRERCADRFKSYTSLDLAKNTPENPLVDERSIVELAPGGPTEVKFVVKGGSYMTSEQQAMAFLRPREGPDDIPGDVGFRVVIECPSRAQSAR